MEERTKKTESAAGKTGFPRAEKSTPSHPSLFAEHARVKKLLAGAFCFLLALLLAGTAAFPGTYPFGIALISAAGGILPTLSVTLGAVFSSLRIPTVGAVYALIFVGLFILRTLLSIWLSSDERSAGPGKNPRKKTSSRSAGLLWRRTAAFFRLILFEEGSPGFTDRTRVTATFAPGDGLFGERSPKSRWPAGYGMNVGTVLRENIRIRMAVSTCAALFAGAWSVVAGGYEYTDLFGAVFSVLTTPLVTYLFYAATDKNMRASPHRELGVYALLMATAFSLHVISADLFSVSLASRLEELTGEAALLRRKTVFDAGVFFSLTATLIVTKNFGWHRGALTGVLCGLTLAPSYVPMYALAAIASAVLDREGEGLPTLFPVLGAGGAALAWAIFTGGVDGFTYVVPPISGMCALLIPLFRYGLAKTPEELFGTAPFLPAKKGESRSRAGDGVDALLLSSRNVEGRVRGLTEGLSSVSSVLYALADRLSKPSVHELRTLVEISFSRRCSRCPGRKSCREGEVTALIRSMTESLSKNGYVSASVVPPSLASRCREMGEILDEVNRSSGEKIRERAGENRLLSAASDWELASELFRYTESEGRDASRADGALEKKLKKLLSLNDFTARSVEVYGVGKKHIVVDGVDLLSTRMGAEDIRRLFEGIVGKPLSQPEFRVDGALLSMSMESVSVFSVRTGKYSRAASGVHRYYCEKRTRDADCGEAFRRDGEDERMEENPSRERRFGDGEKDGEPVRDNAAPRRRERGQYEAFQREPVGTSGDMLTDFEADGRYYMILSDGMGSGREAALTSGMAVSLLKKLIVSGAGLETSLKMLNQIIRSTGRECSATVDIAEIDLTSGEARFIKSGAAPSFVLRDGSIFRLQSKTVPIGILRALDAEMIRFDIQVGDTVVIVSDGVVRSYEEDPWLLDLLTSNEEVLHGDEGVAAMTVVTEAARRGSPDDITCGILRVVKKQAGD